MNWRSQQRGAGLAEVLVGVLVVSLASIGALGFFSHGLGGIQKQGYRRAAAERAREGMEQLAAASLSDIAVGDSADGTQYWLTWTCTYYCSDTTCGWTRSTGRVTDTVSLGGIFSGQREITVRRVHDGTTGTPVTTLDAVELRVKVWFTKNSAADDDSNRVQFKTLRDPSP